MKRQVLGVVLCGGKSSRMGADKALVEVRPGVSQLERQLALLETFCLKRAVSVGPQGGPQRSVPLGVAEIYDVEGVRGPMAGLIAALKEADGWPVLAIACDMPYLEVSQLLMLLSRRVPALQATAFLAADGMPDPMCAVYEPAALAELERLAAEGKGSLRRFLQGPQVERLAVEDPLFLASVNDPADLQAARRRLGFEA
ncbi:molybdenum cofactor guanylyltransferase [Pelagicoccus sp. SDUM812005]|uniref:molybdenum cofactor guanylyltransferase n=1 Tax=Pelagicoccus sp. SDUM812005 TaxID=3041257 RepID=UPI00280F0C5C|nr:molybdenum cofactor guanylyltransferase [Pelagicoccus sp. SDUM812005]MDQ8180430.1 molybdenum cofactor guanylyltransferase [Pelagicoccus sp. SDUM812005]